MVASDDKPLQLSVDGEIWEIRERQQTPGQFDFEWVSGSAGGYGGFTSRLNVADYNVPIEFFERQIRDFMRNADPETGYLG